MDFIGNWGTGERPELNHYSIRSWHKVIEENLPYALALAKIEAYSRNNKRKYYLMDDSMPYCLACFEQGNTNCESAKKLNKFNEREKDG